MMPNPISGPPPKPLGELSRFPRELRDEIYRHVFSKMYKAFYSPSILKPGLYDEYGDHSLSLVEHDREVRIGSDLSILRLQKAITKEAMPLLYSEATFCFCYNVRPDYIPQPLQFGNVDITKRMTHIAVSCDAGCASKNDRIPGHSLAWSSMSYLGARAGPLEFFKGVSIIRKSILVDLRFFEWSIYDAGLTLSPFFEALKQLTGFKTVTLRLTCMCDHYYPAQETSEATIKELLEARQWEKLYARLASVLCTMSNALEPTLGNGTTIELVVSTANDLSWRGQCHTTFHPQAHLAAVAKETTACRDLNAC